MNPLVIGLAGGGTVGGGVVQLVQTKLSLLGIVARIKTMCVRDVEKKRDFDLPAGVKVVSDYRHIVSDDEINCVVEVMGGTTDAKDLIFQCIAKGKHVVTANKALIASCLPELISHLQLHPRVMFGYEAAVCGGIPIIHPMQRDFCSDRITRIAGILNGTTNYVLTKMENEGLNYAPVLAQAQALGYAEANPAADVEGWDARDKLTILTRLAFGKNVPLDKIFCQGISHISGEDIAYAREQLKSSIKMLGVAYRVCGANGCGSAHNTSTTCGHSNGDTSVSLFLSPAIVSKSNVIAGIGGVTNIVQVTSENLGSTSFVGPGAGRLPTANSVLSDLVLIARGELSTPFPSPAGAGGEGGGGEGLNFDFCARFYMRFTISDGLGIIRRVGELCETNGVSIHAVLQAPIKDPNNVCFAVTTEMAKLSQVQAVCRAMEHEAFSRGPALVLPLVE